MISFAVISLLTVQSPTIKLNGFETSVFTEGTSLKLSVEGLKPNNLYRIHGWRKLTKYVEQNGQWGPKSVWIHSWAEFSTDRAGKLSAESLPKAGTWDRKCDYGLLFSGRKDDPKNSIGFREENDNLQLNEIYFSVTADGTIVADKKITVQQSKQEFIAVKSGNLIGGYAYPKSDKPLPTIIVLHGSEGASKEAAYSNALLFASKGFATFYLCYAKQPWIPFPGVKDGAINVPIETLSTVKNWLATRPEVDQNRIGLLGWSKGGEFSLVASGLLDWVKATVAIVPSDRVWEGYGRNPLPGEIPSSWQYKNNPLPFIKYKMSYGDFAAKNPGQNGAAWHQASIDATSKADLEKCNIPVENIKSKVLLLSSGKDEVWPSASMSQRFAARMKAKKKSVESVIYPKAGHSIVGDGGFPVFLFPEVSSKEGEEFVMETGYATIDAMNRTVNFLKKNL